MGNLPILIPIVLSIFTINIIRAQNNGDTRGERSLCGIQPILNSPIVGISQNKSLIFYNETSIESRVVQDLTLVCNATYPLEWAFSTSLGNEWRVLEIRYMEKQFPRYSAQFFYKPSKSQFKPLDLVCRSVEDPSCLQTSVVVKRNNFKGNQSLNIKITRNHPIGQNIAQYSHVEGSNFDCSIKLQYDDKEKAFLCYSKTEINLTINYAENIDEENCYDQFSCGTFYTQNQQCKFKPSKLISEQQIIEKLFVGTDPPIPNVVICKPEGRPDIISAAIHYYFALPRLCEDFSSVLPAQNTFRIHFSSSVNNNADPSEFLRICPPRQIQVFRTDIIEIHCITSLYVFADGLRLEVVSRLNGNWTLPTPTPNVNKLQGYRNYTFEVHINDSSIKFIKCMAPIRKSDQWQSLEHTIGTILEPNEIMFEGGSTTTTIKYESGTILRCAAKGNPPPLLQWSIPDSDTQERTKPLPKELKPKVSISNGFRISEIIIPSKNPETFFGIYNCEAQNQLKFKVKRIVLQEGETSLWFVWGIIVPLAVILVAIFVSLLIWKIIKQTKKLRLLTAAELDEFMNGRPDILNNERSNSSYDVNTYATCLPYNKNYEVLKDQLEIDTNGVLGSGAYGMVLRGFLTLRNGEKVKVAIKTVKPMDEISYFKALMSELKIMGFIGKHDNIVNLLGAFTKNIQNREIFIALEFCHNGSLLNYLKSRRHEFVNHIFNGTLKDIHINRSSLSLTTPLNTISLIIWARQIANGMDFLYHKKVIHGDLAARNILLSQNLTAKIGDFGLSRQLFEYANYIKKQQSPLPWKWLAIECLQDMQFSSKSDVWAYGISIWEVFTLGQVPFAGMRYNDEFMEILLEGTRPPKPQYASLEIYELMKKCWNAEPDERPSFAQIKDFFDMIIQNCVPEEYLDLIEESRTFPVRKDDLHLNPMKDCSKELNEGESCQIVSQSIDKKKSFVRTAIFKKHLTYT